MKIIKNDNCTIKDEKIYIDLPSRKKPIKFIFDVCWAVSSKEELEQQFKRILDLLDDREIDV